MVMLFPNSVKCKVVPIRKRPILLFCLDKTCLLSLCNVTVELMHCVHIQHLLEHLAVIQCRGEKSRTDSTRS